MGLVITPGACGGGIPAIATSFPSVVAASFNSPPSTVTLTASTIYDPTSTFITMTFLETVVLAPGQDWIAEQVGTQCSLVSKFIFPGVIKQAVIQVPTNPAVSGTNLASQTPPNLGSSSSHSSSPDGNAVSPGAAAGIGIGCAALGALIGAFLVFLLMRRRDSRIMRFGGKQIGPEEPPGELSYLCSDGDEKEGVRRGAFTHVDHIDDDEKTKM
jgi:hypothetical protein